MRCTWMYTGDDGRSHFEDLDIPLHPARYGQQSDLIDGDGVIFGEAPSEGLVDFHTAPRRQFVIPLAGMAEIECGDGSKRHIGAGSILLADDTTGQGHITREIEVPRHGIFIPLSPDLDPAVWKVVAQ